jgi:Ca2+/Na+ antiporter
MHRRASFYVFSVWLPNFLLVTLAFLVLTITCKEDNVSERVGLIVTLLLTSIGYRASMGLPRTSTLSWLDAYLLACIAALVTLAVFALNAKITITSWRAVSQLAVSQLGLPLLGLIVVQLLGLICLDHACRRKPDGAVERKRRSTVALTTAIFVLGAFFIGTPTNELLKNLDSPVEICFLVWLLLNLEFFMLFFMSSPLLQPRIICVPEPRESLTGADWRRSG